MGKRRHRREVPNHYWRRHTTVPRVLAPRNALEGRQLRSSFPGITHNRTGSLSILLSPWPVVLITNTQVQSRLPVYPPIILLVYHCGLFVSSVCFSTVCFSTKSIYLM